MSPRRSVSLPGRFGFTLVELLVVVLIIGILAAIALPRFLGQRTRAKNAAAQAAVRHALVAARSYYTQNSESYVGLGPTQLQGYESSLGSSEPADSVRPGDAGVNPQNIWIGNGIDGTNPNTVAGGDSNGGSTVVLCSVSKGDTTYCVKDVSGVATYLLNQSSSTSVSSAAAGSFSAAGWSVAAASPPASWSSAMSSLAPVNWWRLGESSGGYADSGSGGNASTGVGAAATRGVTSLIPSDVGNKAVTFAGNNAGSYIGFGNIVSPSGSYTLMAAFRFTDASYTIGYRRLMTHVNDTPSLTGFNLSLNKSTETPANAFGLDHYGNAGAHYICNSDALTPNTTYLGLVVYDYSAGTIKVYINGAQSGSTTTGATQPMSAAIGGNGFYIGMVSTLVASASFSGTIDEVAYWSSALSAGDVARLWASFNG